jgi:hypothetical protein
MTMIMMAMSMMMMMMLMYGRDDANRDGNHNGKMDGSIMMMVVLQLYMEPC